VRRPPLAIALPDGWEALRRYTPARIALGRAGSGLPTREVLRFGLAHARARDAVNAALDAPALASGLVEIGFPVLQVRSSARDRQSYLARPDQGRRLDEESAAALATFGRPAPEVVVVVADGLSALAVQRHSLPLLKALRDRGPPWVGALAVVALQGRVALGDDVGERLGARLAVVVLGERPGLSSPDSLGIYITHAPRCGRVDAERNCVSNVRPEGLSFVDAAQRIAWIATEALRRGYSGVELRYAEGGSPAGRELLAR